MALLTGENGGLPFVDRHTSLTMRRRLAELWGIGLLALCAALSISLWTYNAGDPSLLSATGQSPRNMLGLPGAIVADGLMQFIGLAGWCLTALMGVWGFRCLTHIGVVRVWGRLPLMPLAIIATSIFASTHAPEPGWALDVGLGGLFGDRMAGALRDLLPLSDDQALMAMSLGLGALSAGLFAAAAGMTMPELGWLWRWLSSSLIRVLGWGASILGVMTGAGYETARKATSAGIEKLKEKRAESREQKLGPAEPTGSWRNRMPTVSMPKVPGLGKREPAAEVSPERVAGAAVPEVEMPPATGALRRKTPEVETYIDEYEDAGEVEDDRTLAKAIRALHAPGKAAPTTLAEPAEREEPVPGSTVNHAPRAKTAAKSRRARREQEPMLALDGLEDKPHYDAPPLDFLARAIPIQRAQTSDIALEENARMLETVLEDYGVRGEIVAVKPGPVVTLYELEPAPGLKASRVIGLSDDIARSMSALAARVSTMPGRNVIGIELPNADREKVFLRETLEHPSYGDCSYPLALALGKDIEGIPVVANLAKMPHLLIAGTTGSGKSVAINTMILSLLYRLSPKECRMIMIDPKMLELSVYDNIPHLLAPVVTDPKKALVALKWVVAEMEERYKKMSKMGVRNIDGYNARVRDALSRNEEFSRTVQTGFDEATGEPIYETETFEPEEMPFIVVIVDEMADLMMVAGKEIEACIQRLAQMARASGIHLIMATQRPSVDVITGTIKANFPTRISFQVTSKIDSRTILGEQGAEQLLGQGDMLYMAGGGKIRRVHGPFVSDEEVEEVVHHLKALGQPDYVGAVTEGGDDETQALVDEKLGLATPGDSVDELYDRAVAIVARDRKCSTSYIQRKLGIGYNKAARLVEQMEDEGVVSSANAVGKRDILVEER
ncbi:DNA translocase FtsK [Rhodobacteraceae bacterium NNCM2]|nr:DNA translocase FtsK [Coraliihabitans acroporae]